MKKHLFKAFAVVALVAVMCATSVFAANTVSIADDGISISAFKDAEGVVDENYVTVTVNYIAVLDSTDAPMSRITFALAALTVEDEFLGNEEKIVYLDEVLAPTDNTYTFVVEKEKIRSALGLASIDQIEGQSLLFKMGGVGVENPEVKTVVYTTPSQTMYGDVNMDGVIDYADAIIMLKYSANQITLTREQLIYGDTLGDGKVDYSDAIAVLRCSARLITYDDILALRKANEQVQQ